MAFDELEFLVHFNRTLCISLPADDVSLSSLKSHVQEREGVPADRLELFVNGVKLCENDDLPRVPAIVRARLIDGLLGGKGGFGAMLRSQGKGASSKVTTSFGACRDLNGRRLRHVNQEIAMDKWRQESDQRDNHKKTGVTEREIMDDETASGIPGWFLATPSWAEGIRKSYMKRRRNTMMCKNWLQARENGRTAPPKAPRWWGCPRGRDCDFAHGETELRGEGLTEYKRQKKDEQYQKKQQELNRYVNYEDDMPTGGGGIREAILQGMKTRNTNNSNVTAATPVPAAVAAASELPQLPPTSILLPDKWLVPVDGTVLPTFKHGLCELRGQGNFGTATVEACSITTGKWYYEVRLVTDGIVQLGWADSSFTANSTSGDGVGDHARSWAYDGARQLTWTGGKEHEYGAEWESGDIIGCLLDADHGTIQFSRNGELMEPAFTSIKKDAKQEKGFFPAISIEKTEILLINIGAQPFLYAPAGYQPIAAKIAIEKQQQPVAAAPVEKSKKDVASPSGPTEKEAAKVVAPASAAKDDTEIKLLDLETFPSASDLEKLGLETLKQQLQARKLKCGGTLEQRAMRLFSVKGKSWDEMDPKIKDSKALRK